LDKTIPSFGSFKYHNDSELVIVWFAYFEKAYDKVRWPFLIQALRMKGFSPKWITWVQSFISGGSVAINVNDDVGSYFKTKKGLRQGDPLSPLLFNIVADMLAILIKKPTWMVKLVEWYCI
jgi:hypothetical protein